MVNPRALAVPAGEKVNCRCNAEQFVHASQCCVNEAVDVFRLPWIFTSTTCCCVCRRCSIASLPTRYFAAGRR